VVNFSPTVDLITEPLSGVNWGALRAVVVLEGSTSFLALYLASSDASD
jgi:hypothetical protein